MDNNKQRIAELVTKIQNGDNTAFNELYEMTNRRAYFIAFEFVKNEADAEDILQDSYMKALEKIEELDNPESFSSWFNRIVANKSKDFLKKKKPTLFEEDESEAFEVIADEDTSFSPAENLDQLELQKTVMEVIDELSEEKRACIMMMYYEELSVRQISETLEMSESAVKSKLFHARKDMKEKLAKRKVTSLYSTAPIGLIIWALRGMSGEISKAFAESGASAKILAEITAAKATAAAAGTGTATTGGIMAKLSSMSVAQKVIAGVATVAVTAGIGTAVAVKNAKPEEVEKENEGVTTIVTQIVTENNQDFHEEREVVEEYKEGLLTYELYDDGTATVLYCDQNDIRDYLLHHDIPNVAQEDLDITTVINIPSSVKGYTVTKIADRAFNVRALACLSLPSTMKEISPYALVSCLCKNIVVDKNNPYFTADENGVLYSKDMTKIIKCPYSAAKSYTIPATVTEIYGYAFSLSFPNLERIELEGANKFFTTDANGILFNKDKTELIFYPRGISATRYVIPDTVNTIDQCAFRTMKNLVDISFNNVEVIAGAAFDSCAGLKSVSIPRSVKNIYTITFQGCSNLERVFIPKEVTNIESDAFNQCFEPLHIYYEGSKEEWGKVVQSTEENYLSCKEIIIHYNATGLE